MVFRRAYCDTQWDECCLVGCNGNCAAHMTVETHGTSSLVAREWELGIEAFNFYVL